MCTTFWSLSFERKRSGTGRFLNAYPVRNPLNLNPRRVDEPSQAAKLFEFLTIKAFVISSIAVAMVTRYLVELESGSWLHAKVDDALYSLSKLSKSGEADSGVFGFARYGWNCVICVGQWVSFAMFWGVTRLAPWNWPMQAWVAAVALNGINFGITLLGGSNESEGGEE